MQQLRTLRHFSVSQSIGRGSESTTRITEQTFRRNITKSIQSTIHPSTHIRKQNDLRIVHEKESRATHLRPVHHETHATEHRSLIDADHNRSIRYRFGGRLCQLRKTTKVRDDIDGQSGRDKIFLFLEIFYSKVMSSLCILSQ